MLDGTLCDNGRTIWDRLQSMRVFCAILILTEPCPIYDITAVHLSDILVRIRPVIVARARSCTNILWLVFVFAIVIWKIPLIVEIFLITTKAVYALHININGLHVSTGNKRLYTMYVLHCCTNYIISQGYSIAIPYWKPIISTLI